MRPLLLAFVSVAALGCYEPAPADKGFKCDGDHGYLCPEGLACDRTTNLCVAHLPDLGLVPSDLGFSVDQSVPPGPRTCDQRVTAGAFSGLVPLTALNTAADETSISVNAAGTRLYYLSGGALMTADLSGKTASAPQAANIAGTPAVLLGGSVNADSSWWFAGNDGAGGATSLFQAKGTLPNLTATAQVFPTTFGTCAFTDPVFRDGAAANDLYVSFSLGGCGTAPYVAQGLNNKQIGAFFAAFSTPGFRRPTLLAGGLTMLVASTGSGMRRLYFATRPSTDDTTGDTIWVGPSTLPMGGIADPSASDWQAVVSPDCSTLYLSSVRTSGAGGADLYAADIAAQ